MSKKSRRSKAKYKAADKSPKTKSGNIATQSDTVVESRRTIPSTQPVSAIKSPGYGYVLTELKQIGIIAGLLILIIIVLAFVLN
jgi:hypothetical protein